MGQLPGLCMHGDSQYTAGNLAVASCVDINALCWAAIALLAQPLQNMHNNPLHRAQPCAHSPYKTCATTLQRPQPCARTLGVEEAVGTQRRGDEARERARQRQESHVAPGLPPRGDGARARGTRNAATVSGCSHRMLKICAHGENERIRTTLYSY